MKTRFEHMEDARKKNLEPKIGDVIMRDVLPVFLSALTGFALGFLTDSLFCREVHKIPMEALGIKRFKRCEINTTNCHSNWYEIIWKKVDNNGNK